MLAALAKGFRKRYNPGSCNINFGVDFSRFKLPHLDFDWPWKQKNLEFDWPWKQNKDKNDVVDSTKSPKKEWCEDLSATWNGLGSQVQSTLRTFVQSLIKVCLKFPSPCKRKKITIFIYIY